MENERKVRDVTSQKFPSYFKYDLFVHPAFQLLKPAAKMILIQFYYEIEMSEAKRRSKKYTATIRNRHEIVLPYFHIAARQGLTEKEYRERKRGREVKGYSDKTINASIRQIMAHGFLEKVKRGGSAKHDFAVYSISEKWRDWQPGQKKAIHTLPVNGKIGFQRKISLPLGKSPRLPLGKSQVVKNEL